MWQHTVCIAARSSAPLKATCGAVTSWCRLAVLIPHQRLLFTTSWPVRQGYLRPGPGREMAIAAAAEARRARSATSAATDVAHHQGATSATDVDNKEEDEDEDEDDSDDEDIEGYDDDEDDGENADSDLASNEGIIVIHTKEPPHRQRPTPQDNQVYKEIVLQESDFRERFVKGGGNGGQKINKTNSNVELKHYETGIVIHCQATRSLPQNRKLARRILIARLDEYYNGAMSKRAQKADKIRDKKRRAARKSAKKYASNKEAEEAQELISTATSTSTTTSTLEPLDLTKMTLEDILSMDNKKPSRRKAKK